MAEEHEKTRSRDPVSVTIAAWAVSGLGAAYLLWTSADGPRPFPALHLAVTTTLAVAVIVAWLWFVADRGASARRRDNARVLLQIQTLMAQVELNRTTSSSRLHRAVVDALENRGDIPTDRIVAIVNRGTTDLRGELAHFHDLVDARFTVVEAALADHVCMDYSDGYADGLARVPASESRRHLKSINGRSPS